ncbi:LysR family transcriptional regulator [Streptomyces sp. NPDC004539]|uniref:LysR family transcriptional regulator n=1 Tax=Streptomyces sp. NPDC004539 TaxID=3154280 RepID=UPI0033BF288F
MLKDTSTGRGTPTGGDRPRVHEARQPRADDLRYLLAVAHTGRLVAAAAALGVDHTTVSRRIRALEKTLSARLLERGSDGWELTELGRIVAERARPIEDALEHVVLAARGMAQDTLVGNFRITAPDGFGALFTAPALARLQREHPGLTVELITATRQLNLHQSGFDLAIAVGEPVTRRLFSESLTDYSLGLYASEAYLAEHGTPDRVEDLRDHTVIFYVDSLLQVGDLDLGLNLPGVTGRFTSTSIFAQREATVAGAGIGLLPRFMTVGVPQLRELDGLGVDITLTFTLAARRESVSRPAVRMVRNALHEEVRRRRDELLRPGS